MKEHITQDELLLRYFFNPEIGCFYRIRRGEIGKAVGYYGKKYATLNVKGRSYLIHRLAWLYVYGELPEGDIDHINGDPKDNRIQNLRCATRQQNCWNRKKAANNTSGFKGVSFCKRTGLYVAQAKQDGRVVVLGRFSTPEDASEKYEDFAKARRGDFHMDTLDPVKHVVEPEEYSITAPQRDTPSLKRRVARSGRSIQNSPDFIIFT